MPSPLRQYGMNRSLKLPRVGFTLLELMIVLAIMALMMGFVGLTLIGGGGASLGAAQREVISLIQQARMQAVLSGKETRLIVHDSPSDPEKFHRYLEIVFDDSNGSGAWRPVGDGIFLPEDSYFVPSLTRFNQSVNPPPDVTWPAGAHTIWSHDASQSFKLGSIRKGLRAENGPDALEFRYLSFDKSGNVICPSGASAPGGLPPSPCLVIGVGSLTGTTEGKVLQFHNSGDLAGVLLRRYGGFATLSSTDFEE